MSSAEQRLPPPDPAILAALVWNMPALLRAGTPGAIAFAQAFGPPPINIEEDNDEDTLARAAHAVVLVRGGDYSGAAKHLDYLRHAGDAWTQLLGLLLVAWSAGSEDMGALEQVHALARLIPNRQLRARILNKASLFAYDKGWNDLGDSLLADASKASRPGSHLRTVLTWGSFDRGVQQELPRLGQPQRNDPLVELRWVHDAALNGAHAALELQAEDRMSATWSWTIRTGRTPLDEMFAAEAQATWAGAYWMRGWIRKQLGAHLISGAASTPEQWAYGLVVWILGGGKAAPAFERAEPHLDSAGADLVVETLARESGKNAKQRFKEAATAAWAIISDRVATAMFERVAVEPVTHVAMADAQRIWARLLWRDPDLWAKRYVALSHQQRRSLLSELPPYALSSLPVGVRNDILVRALEEVESGSRDDWTFYLAASLASALGEKKIYEQVIAADPPAASLVLIAEEQPSRNLDEALAVKEQTFIEIVSRENTEALQQGKMSFGARSPRVELGRIGALRRVSAPPCVPVLVKTAITPQLPGEFRTEARQALSLLHRARKLDDPHLEKLHTASDEPNRFASHGNVTSRLLHIFRLQALTPSLSAEERTALVTCCRDPDPRVRVIAMDVCSETLKADLDDQALVWGLVSGLFDPSEDVVRVSLAAVGDGRLVNTPAAEQVAFDRLPRIYQASADTTRAAVTSTAQRMLARDPQLTALEQLLALARVDKSWWVRRVAAEANEVSA